MKHIAWLMDGMSLTSNELKVFYHIKYLYTKGSETSGSETSTTQEFFSFKCLQILYYTTAIEILTSFRRMLIVRNI